MSNRTESLDRVLRTGEHRRAARPAALVRVVAGLLFVVFGLPKFTDHARWVRDFGSYGLPESSLLVYGTGLAEILGGLALIGALLLRPVAALLMLVMAGAVLGGGLIGGNPTSLTLAPALLLAAGFVLWSTWPKDRRATSDRRPGPGW